MPNRAAVLLTTLLLAYTLGSAVAAEPSVLSIDCAERQQPAALHIELPSGEVREVAVQLPWTAALPPGLEWPVKLRAVSESCWSPTAHWDGSESLRLRLIETGRLQGTWQQSEEYPASEGEVATSLVASFLRHEPPRADMPLQLEQAVCEVSGRTWSCELPAGRVDLRLDTAKLASDFLLDAEILAGEVTTWGSLQPLPGAVVEGWVVTDGDSANAVVEARMLADSEPSSFHEAERLDALLTQSRPVDTRGRFRIEGLRPSRYQFSALTNEAESDAVNLSILTPGSIVELPQPLVLSQAVIFTVNLAPSVDPWGLPWELALYREIDRSNVDEKEAVGRSGPSGRWSSTKISQGVYSLRVFDSKGGRWHRQNVEVGPYEDELYVALDVIEVRGSIQQGDESIETTVHFGTGSRAIQMTSDEDGVFEGSLPREGIWDVAIGKGKTRVSLKPFEVRRARGSRFARVEIDLPDTSVTGHVTLNDKPVRAAVFAFSGSFDAKQSAGRRREVSIITSDDGRFEANGLTPGTIRFRATRENLESDWASIDLKEGLPEEIQLELRERNMARGTILLEGRPAGGVRIRSQPRNGFGAQTMSGPDGRFDLQVAPGLETIDLILTPPTGGLSLRRWKIPPPDSGSLLSLDSGQGELLVEDSGPGVYVVYDGVVVPLSTVQIELGRSRISATSEGKLAHRGIATGIWWICTTPEFSTESCTESPVFANSTTASQP